MPEDNEKPEVAPVEVATEVSAPEVAPVEEVAPQVEPEVAPTVEAPLEVPALPTEPTARICTCGAEVIVPVVGTVKCPCGVNHAQ